MQSKCYNCQVLMPRDYTVYAYYDESTSQNFYSCGDKCNQDTKWVRDILRYEREGIYQDLVKKMLEEYMNTDKL